MNKVILMGRLTKDVEVRYSQGAEPMANCRFTLAVDRRMRRDNNSGSNEPTADFISCKAFRHTAEFLGKYGKQGTKFVIEGRIETGSYNNREGQKVYTTDVIVDNVEFAESKGSSQNAQNGGQAQPQNGGYQQPQQAPQQPQYQQPQGNGYQQQNMQAAADPWGNQGGFMNIPDGIDEELPFK